MKRLFWILILVPVLTLSCNRIEQEEKEDTGDNPFLPITLSTKQAGYVSAGEAFAGRFIDQVDASALRDDKHEWFVSPLSLQIALGMLLNGAQGETAAEICQTLGYKDGEINEINEWSKMMLEQLPKIDKKTELSMADAIFFNNKISLKAPFREAVGSNYFAALEALDFSNRKATADFINSWCDRQTKGMIPKVIDEYGISPDAMAFLANALYFKSVWSEKFPKEDSRNETFTLENGKKDKVRMMKLDGKKFLYGENDLWQAIRLPYGNGAYGMTVVLPQKGHSVREVTEALGKGEVVSTNQEAMADLWLPGFEMKYHIELNDILKTLGMPMAFDPWRADFLAMSEYESYVSFVQQDAAIKVDEEGTEAAAVTIIGMNFATAIPSEPRKVVFHADRPFLYLITESSTGAILFAGKYNGGN